MGDKFVETSHLVSEEKIAVIDEQIKFANSIGVDFEYDGIQKSDVYGDANLGSDGTFLLYDYSVLEGQPLSLEEWKEWLLSLKNQPKPKFGDLVGVSDYSQENANETDIHRFFFYLGEKDGIHYCVDSGRIIKKGSIVAKWNFVSAPVPEKIKIFSEEAERLGVGVTSLKETYYKLKEKLND